MDGFMNGCRHGENMKRLDWKKKTRENWKEANGNGNMMKNEEINCFLKQQPEWWPSKGTLLHGSEVFLSVSTHQIRYGLCTTQTGLWISLAPYIAQVNSRIALCVMYLDASGYFLLVFLGGKKYCFVKEVGYKNVQKLVTLCNNVLCWN